MAPTLLFAAAVLLWTWRLTLTQLGMAGLDAFTYFYPNASYASEALRSGRLPLWNPDIFLGVPFLANLQVGLFYPPNLLRLFVPAYRAAAWLFATHLVVAGVGTFHFARRGLGMSRFGGVIAGLAMAGSGALGAQAEHLNQISALAWLPWLLLLLRESHDRRGIYPFLASGLVALVLFAGHAQSALIVLAAGLLYAGYLALGRKVATSAGWATVTVAFGAYAGIAALGAAVAAIQLAPAWELSALSLRSGGLELREALSFSLPPHLLLVSLLPAFTDSPFSEYIAYIGVSGLVLGIVGLVQSPHRAAVRLGVGLAAAGLFLALGVFNPVNIVLVGMVPGFDLFRAPARWIFLTSFGLSLLAGLGAEAWLAQGWKISLRSAIQARKVFAGGLGLAVFLALVWFGPQISAATWSAWLVAAGSILGILAWRGKGRGAWSGGAMVCVLIAELFLAGRYLPHARVTAPEAYTSLRTSTAHLLADRGLHRVVSVSETEFDPGDLEDIRLSFGDALSQDSISDFIVATKWKEVLAPNLAMVYGLSTVDGYDGGILPAGRYLDLARLLHGAGGEPLADGRLYQTLDGAPPAHLLNLLNVKYLIMDKVRDLWLDDVYYDLGLRVQVVSGKPLEVPLPASPSVIATHLGIVYAIEGLPSAEETGVVAEVRIEDGRGRRTVYPVPTLADGGTRQLGDLEGPERAPFYQTLVPLSEPGWPAEVSVSVGDRRTSLEIAGMSLIDGRTGGHLPVAVSAGGRLRLVHSGDVKIYENLTHLPRAFLVEKIEVEEDDVAVLVRLSDPGFEVDRVAVVSEPIPPVDQERTAGGWVEIVSYAPERVVLETGAPGARLLVITDAFYPGWMAEVDGEAVPMHRVDYFFRGIRLEAGTHSVVMRYEPISLKIGAAITGLALAVTVAGAVGGWTGGRRSAGLDIIRRREG